MSNKIFRAIWTASISVFLVALIFVLIISYNYFSTFQVSQLKSKTELAAQGVALSGSEFFDDLVVENYRITWIDSEGKVLYDSQADSSEMENHLEREEVKEAIENGYGESARYSNTLAQKQLYAAKRLPDGSIVRLSIVQAAVWTLILRFMQPICLMVLVVLILSFVLASGLAKKIVKPINEIDLDNPEQYYKKENYKEVEPLLRHISVQQAEIKRDQEQIEQTALIRQEFSANVSHELKSPLHAISGYAELLENGMVKEEDISGFAGKIRDESLRLTKLVEDIIDLTKLDSGASEMKREECDLYRIAENAVDSLLTTAAKADISLEITGEDTPVTGIPQQLYSIVYNLCDNAIKYNHKGGDIFVSVRPEGRNAVLVVKDTGIGIPEESRDRVFERFYRVDKSRSKEAGGTGLGLSIVKHAVMIHGGEIKLESSMGEGSTFTVIIPGIKGR